MDQLGATPQALHQLLHFWGGQEEVRALFIVVRISLAEGINNCYTRVSLPASLHSGKNNLALYQAVVQ